MFHFFEAITNKKGDALTGYFVKAIDPASNGVVDIYADESATPIVSVSGVANAALVDTDGNASFYIAGGTYHLDIYATDSTTFVRRVSNLPMVDIGANTTNNVANVATRTALAAITGPAVGTTRFLTESGREGQFVWSSVNLSTQVTADPNQGIYVAPASAPTGASGAWVRKYESQISAKWFGAIGDGVTDDTTAVQKAIDSGATDIFIPAGTFLVSSLLMPNVFGFVLRGVGSASKLKAKSGASNAMIRWATASEVYNEQTITGLQLIGTNGSQHLIDTTGQGGLTLRDILVTDVPVGKSAIYDNSVSVAGHDNRFIDLRIYSPTTAGHSGLRMGPLSTDAIIQNYIFNGNFLVSYGIYADSGAINIAVGDGHIYNAADNIVKLAGGNNFWQFTGTTLDNATNNLVEIAGSNHVSFVNNYFEAVKSGKSAVNVTGTGSGVRLTAPTFNGAAGAVSCVVSGASVTDVNIRGGTISGTFSTPFNFGGTRSYADGVAGFTPWGLRWSEKGIQATSQAQATTEYLGIGSNATEAAAVLMADQDGVLTQIFIAMDNTPAAGQTRTYQARVNGSNVGSALVVNNGGFGGTITLNQAVSQNDQVTVSSVYSATAGSARTRWKMDFRG